MRSVACIFLSAAIAVCGVLGAAIAWGGGAPLAALILLGGAAVFALMPLAPLMPRALR